MADNRYKLDNPRSILTKEEDGSVFIDLYGRHFTKSELYEYLEDMIELSENASILTSKRQRN